MNYASIGPVATYLPERIETNEELQAEFPQWDLPLIFEKTGIRERHIAAPDQCASDLGVLAAQRLFERYDIDPSSIDFLLFCTQTPDYPLPTTACLMQDRLGIPTSAGALDFNLGCSGYVYGLAMADGLIRTGSVRRLLLITAETYSKYIHPTDRSLRTIFGDGAAATLIDAGDRATLSGFRYGTDGSGADTLMATEGGARLPEHAHKPRHRKRWPSNLYMDGPAIITFSVDSIPVLVDQVLTSAGLTAEQIDFYLMHQATLKMMTILLDRLKLDAHQMPIALEDCGNTVSSTLPILIERMRERDELRPGSRNLMVGFGVGWSWSGCVWEETWSGKKS